jgi:hypothetical protein
MEHPVVKRLGFDLDHMKARCSRKSSTPKVASQSGNRDGIVRFGLPRLIEKVAFIPWHMIMDSKRHPALGRDASGAQGRQVQAHVR